MEVNSDFSQTSDTKSMPFPWIRRGIIVVSFIILVIWIAVISFYTYQDPNVLCFTNQKINILTYVMLGTSLSGLLIYIISSDSQLKLTSWIHRIPMFWDSIMDSGYTPYFNPDYFEIKNGRYVKVQNNAYEVDNIGLPIVNTLTPLNSFNYNIYRRYYKSVVDTVKRWKDATPDPMINILRKYLIERSQIVLVGATCMIVKARSGEHLLIHNSRYNDFIQDQILSTRRTDLDDKRRKELENQIKYIEGLQHFTNKLDNRFAEAPAKYEKDTPLYEHYDQLFNEMIQLNECNKNIIPQLQEVLKELLYSSNIPQSLKHVHSKFIELNIAKAVKDTVVSSIVQDEILNKLPVGKSNNTENVLNAINKLAGSKYSLAIQMDNRIATSKNVLNQYISDPNLLESKLNKKTINNACKFITKIKVMPKYDTKKLLAPFITAANAGYNSVHGVAHAIKTIKNVSASSGVSINKAINTILKSKNSPTVNLLKNTMTAKEHAKIELAKSESIKRLLDEHLKIKAAEKAGLEKVIAINPSRMDVRSSANLTEAEIIKANNAFEAENLVNNQVRNIFTKTEQIEANIKHTGPTKKGLEDAMASHVRDISDRERKSKEMINELDMLTTQINRNNAEKADIQRQLEQLSAITQATFAQTEEMREKMSDLAKKDLEISSLSQKYKDLELKNQANTDSISSLESALRSKTDELKRINEQREQDAIKLAELTQQLQQHSTDRERLINENKVMIDSIRNAGDDKLKAVVQQNESKIGTIKTELGEVTNALHQATLQKQQYETQLQMNAAKILEQQQELELAKRKAREAAIKITAHHTVASSIFSALTKTSAEKLEEEKQYQTKKQFDALNQQLIEADTKAARLENALQLNEQTLSKLKDEQDVSIATIAALSQKTIQSDADKQELENQRQALGRIIRELEQTNAANAKNLEIIEQLKVDKDAYEKLLEANTENKYKNELAELARLKANETQVALQLEKIAAEKLAIESLANQSKSNLSELQREKDAIIRQLRASSEAYQEQIADLQQSQEENLGALAELCASVAENLHKYETKGIRINIKHSGLPIKVDSITIDLKLIQKLNKQVAYYLKGKGTKSETLTKEIIPKVYTPHSTNTPTLLKENEGKIFAFVYSMYSIISKHKKITEAIANIKKCALQEPEQYQILNECKIFIKQGYTLFKSEDSIDYMQQAISAQNINYLTSGISKIKASSNNATFDGNVYQYIIGELNKFAFTKNDSTTTSTSAKKVSLATSEIPRRPSEALVKPSRPVQTSFKEPSRISYEEQERRKRQGITEKTYDTGEGEATIITPPNTSFDKNLATSEEIDSLIDETGARTNSFW